MFDDYIDTLTEAVTPTAADLLESRSTILQELSDHPSRTISEFITTVLAPYGVAPTASHGEALRVERSQGLSGLDRTHPVILRERARRSIREALGALIADGVVMQAAGSGQRPADAFVPFAVTSGGGGQSGSAQIPDAGPSFTGGTDDAIRWRLVRPADHPLQQLARSDLLEGLDDLLGPRGVQVLDEAIRCFRAGRYLASVDLLAAASEAAWFTLGRAVPDDRKLADLAGRGDGAADVIDKTSQAIEGRRVLHRHEARDARARAAHLRELRNYGLHPVGPQQDHLEEAFTEAGAALLFMSARSYFLTLREALAALRTATEPPG